ncbi:MAG: hypothetical protein F6K35_21080 [Okeania sp. SIO2H7]|nr:hypothetical protein [Okeania sp. SIO2H7]
MKKIPTVFQREPNNLKQVLDVLNPEVELVFAQCDRKDFEIHKKYDGQPCLYQDGKLYTRFNAKLFQKKRGKIINEPKLPPENSIPCSKPDQNTGDWPHWRLVNKTQDEWVLKAFENAGGGSVLSNGTYEAVGPHFQTNLHRLTNDILVSHNALLENCSQLLECNDLFKAFKDFMKQLKYEGIVLYQSGLPVAKLKRKDFGLPEICYDFP